MRRNICYHHVKFTDGVNITAQALLHHERSIMRWLTVWLLYVAWSVSGQVAASSSHADGGGRCGITSLSSCLYRGSWIYLSVGLSDSPPWRVEVCDREMEKDGGWTGRVRADCLLCNEYKWAPGLTLLIWFPSLKTGMGRGCGLEVAHPASLPLCSLKHSLHCTCKTHTSYICVSVLISWWLLCGSVQPEQLLVRLSAEGNFIIVVKITV